MFIKDLEKSTKSNIQKHSFNFKSVLIGI
jgi:hypothetical protein